MSYLDEHLFACVTKGDLNKLITLLRKPSTSINAIGEDGISLLHYAIINDRIEIALFLMNDSECSLTTQDNCYGHTPLHSSCMLNLGKMAYHLLNQLPPKALNIPDKFGWTPLHHAARNGNLEICTKLIKHQAKPDLKNELGKTPLHYAAQHGYLQVLKYLYDFTLKSLITPSITECFSLPVLTLLHSAALNNHTNVIEWLQSILYPPSVKCQRALHQDGTITSDELAEDTASIRGHHLLKATLCNYRLNYESWVQDFCSDHSPLGHLKIFLCGPTSSGKTTLYEVFAKGHIQFLLGSDDLPEGSKKYTYGVNITSLNRSTNDTHHLWDFSGDLNSYITHYNFMTIEHSVYVIVVDATNSISDIESNLEQWLSMVSMRNLGSIPIEVSSNDLISLAPKVIDPFVDRKRAASVPFPPSFRSRLHSASTTLKVPTRFTRSTSPSSPPQPSSHLDLVASHAMPTSTATVTTSMPLAPILIAASHVDLLSSDDRHIKLSHIGGVVTALSTKYSRSLDILSQVYPLNSNKHNSTGMKALKEQLQHIQSSLSAQILYPRIFRKIIKKIETIKLISPETKVIKTSKFCNIVKSEINPLMSNKQMCYVLKCLTSCGLILFLEHGCLSQWVILDPYWLCNSILGHILAPPSYKHSIFKPEDSHLISINKLVTSLTSNVDPADSNLLLELITSFGIAYVVDRHEKIISFPSFQTTKDPMHAWNRDSQYVAYIGTRITFEVGTKFVPIGFFTHLKVQACSLITQNDCIELYCDRFIITCSGSQCLVLVGENCKAIDMIGRCCEGKALECFQKLEHIQNEIAKLNRQICPAVFFNIAMLSAADLQEHHEVPHVYGMEEIVSACQNDTPMLNGRGISETVLQVLFLNDEAIRCRSTGRKSRVVFIQDEIFSKVDLLLSTEDTHQSNWRDLAKHINLSEYIQILENLSQPAKCLILKWGEKPRWTVDNLLFALQDIGRKDIYNFIRAKTDKKYSAPCVDT